MKALARRLAKARRKIGSLALDTVYARVVDVLLERSYEQYGEWQLDAGAEFIASLVGASREMVSRVTADLIDRGLLRRSKRQIFIPNRGTLETYATDQRSAMRIRRNGALSNQPACPSTAQQLAA